MSFCTKCGKQIESTLNFCPICGQKQQTAPVSSPRIQQPETTSPAKLPEINPAVPHGAPTIVKPAFNIPTAKPSEVKPKFNSPPVKPPEAKMIFDYLSQPLVAFVLFVSCLVIVSLSLIISWVFLFDHVVADESIVVNQWQTQSFRVFPSRTVKLAWEVTKGGEKICCVIRKSDEDRMVAFLRASFRGDSAPKPDNIPFWLSSSPATTYQGSCELQFGDYTLVIVQKPGILWTDTGVVHVKITTSAF